MQKKIIALAVASALTVPAMAYAEATVYGQVRLSIDQYNNGNKSTASYKANQLNSNASRVGVKGSEDLGGGMSAMWQMEAEINMDDGTTGPGQLFNRETYLGLKSDSIGTLKLGNLDTPYKVSTRRLDMFADTAADNRAGDGTGVGNGNKGQMGRTSGFNQDHNVRLPNTIAYVSPNFSGVTIAAASAFSNEQGANPNPPAQTKSSVTSVAAMYEQGSLYATVAMQTLKSGSATNTAFTNFGTVGDKSQATVVGVGYMMDAFTVNAIYENLKDKPAAGGDTKTTNIYLAGKFAVSSSDAVKLAYTMNGEDKQNGVAQADTKAKQIALGVDHAMSKNTTVYALYTALNNDGATAPDPKIISVGVNHSF